MKKTLLFIIAVVLMPCVGFCGTITFDNISSYNDLSVPIYNDNLNKLYEKINTSIDSENITNQTIQSEDIATAVNPLVRDNENIGEYVYSGLTLPTTGAATSATITAGTAYVTEDDAGTLHRVVTATSSPISTIPGYNASADNWAYLDFAGSFSISVVGVGADQPATPSNSLVLGVMTIAAGTITSASESAKQTTPPSLRLYVDFVQGLYVSADSTDSNAVDVGRGTIDLGSSGGLRRNTAAINIDFDVSGVGGLSASDTQQSDTFYYLFAYPDEDNATNYKGIAGSSKTGVADVTDERLVGWTYASTATALSPDSVGGYRGLGSGQPNVVVVEGATDISTTSTSMVDMDNMVAKIYTSGRPVSARWNNVVYAASSNQTIFQTLSIDGIGSGADTAIDSSGSTAYVRKTVHGEWTGILGEGEHTFQVRWAVDGGTGNQEGTSAIRRLIVEEL